MKLTAGQYERAKQILTEHKDGHNKLAQLLIDREVIFAEDVEEIFGKRPWASRSSEIMQEEEKESVESVQETSVAEIKEDNNDNEKSDC